LTSLPSTPIRRILLALEAGNGDAASMEAASRLAAQLDAELHGLFVEDINLIRLAALPFAREVGFTSATTRQLQSDDIERSLRSQAMRAQESLAASATHLQVRWSFQVVRGEIKTTMAEAAMQADLVIVTHGRRQALSGYMPSLLDSAFGSIVCPLLVLPSFGTVTPPIAVLYDSSPQSDRALQLAAQLSERNNHEIRLYIAASGPKQAADLQKRATAELAQTGARFQVRVLSAAGPAELANMLNRAGVATLLMAADNPVAGPGMLRKFLDRIQGAVFLIR
jgi:nucleotide-binding universal stress UspA family protein